MKPLERSVNDLIDEIKENGQERKDFIEMKEIEILKNFSQIQDLKTKKFFKLPLINIFSIISKYDFSCKRCEQFSFFNFIISNIFEEHSTENEILNLLKHIHFHTFEYDNENLNTEEIINLLKIFKNVDLFQQLSIKFYETEILPIKDYSYEIEQKDKIISKLETTIEEYNQSEKSIFSSVQYLIEKEKVYKNIKNRDNQSMDFACKIGRIDIVEHLIEKENAYVETLYDYGRTPLIIASYFGHLDIVKYLIEKANANKEAKDHLNETPLCKSCESGNLLLVN